MSPLNDWVPDAWVSLIPPSSSSYGSSVPPAHLERSACRGHVGPPVRIVWPRRPAKSVGERLQVSQRRRDVRERLGRFVLFDDVPLHPGGTAASTIAGIGRVPSPTGASRARAGRAILHVEQPDAIPVRPDLRDGVPAADGRPVDVEFELDLGRKACQEDVPDRRSRRAARTRNRGCDSRGGCRPPPSAGRTRRAPRRSHERRRRSPGPPRASTARSPADNRARPGGRPRLRHRHAGARCPRARRPARSPCRRASPSIRPGRSREGPASSTARYPAADDGAQRPGQILGGELDGACRAGALSGRVASGHDRATATSAGAAPAPRCRSLSTMTPLGIGIVGTGNIAGGYAKDALTHPEIRLVAATDLDPDRAPRSPLPMAAARMPRSMTCSPTTRSTSSST